MEKVKTAKSGKTNYAPKKSSPRANFIAILAGGILFLLMAALVLGITFSQSDFDEGNISVEGNLVQFTFPEKAENYEMILEGDSTVYTFDSITEKAFDMEKFFAEVQKGDKVTMTVSAAHTFKRDGADIKSRYIYAMEVNSVVYMDINESRNLTIKDQNLGKIMGFAFLGVGIMTLIGALFYKITHNKTHEPAPKAEKEEPLQVTNTKLLYKIERDEGKYIVKNKKRKLMIILLASQLLVLVAFVIIISIMINQTLFLFFSLAILFEIPCCIIMLDIVFRNYIVSRKGIVLKGVFTKKDLLWSSIEVLDIDAEYKTMRFKKGKDSKTEYIILVNDKMTEDIKNWTGFIKKQEN